MQKNVRIFAENTNKFLNVLSKILTGEEYNTVKWKIVQARTMKEGVQIGL